VTDVGRLPDGELAALAATGDAAAFRLIMERHNARLYRTARAVLRNDSEAEDAVQEAYVRAFAKLGAFRGESSLATWLTRIALNEALGRIRKRRPSEELSAVDDETAPNRGEVIWFPGMPNDADPERAVARREISGLLERAIDALPEAFRVVFMLRAVEDMSVEDTAATLAIPEATVKTRLHRARRLLRETIEEELGPAVSDAFPFAGRRCVRTTEIVLERLGLTPPAGNDATT
jgi:RNA polymerase sigma-70 factor (ECF subfamily)